MSKNRNDAELLHHAQSVPIAVGIHDFSVSDVVDGHSIHGYFLIGRWDSQVFAPLGTGNGPAGNYFIFLGDHVLNGEVQIGVACEEDQKLAFVSFGTNGGTENVWAMQSVAWGDDFAYKFKLAFVPNFLIEALDNGFVLGRHGVPPTPNECFEIAGDGVLPHGTMG